MKSRLLLLLWALALVLWGGLLGRQLRIASDLTLFMPEAQTEVERLLVTQLREGPGSRLMLIALEGDSATRLAHVSRNLAADLRASDLFLRVENGEPQEQPELQQLVLQHRYLLSPGVTPERFSAAGLRAALEERLLDLGSPAELFIRDLLPQDPTGEVFSILDTWQPPRRPELRHGVWFARGEPRALLLAETRAAGFDLDAQTQAVGRLQALFEDAALGTDARMQLTGAGAFGVAIQERTKRDAQLFSLLDSVLLTLILLAAYRVPRIVLLAGLPLASAVLAGMSAVLLLYGGVHGITLAFGSTLLGIALDYPVHVFSHRLPGGTAWAGLRHNWPTLWISALSACVAYAALVFTDFSGLAQLGVFTVAGLATAALCTRWLLPALLPAAPFEIRNSHVSNWQARLDRLPPRPWLAPALSVAALAVIAFGAQPLWQNDLATLSPVPQALQEADGQLRQDLGGADVRYLALVAGPDAEAALRRSEQVAAEMAAQVAAGSLDGYDYAARYLPSQALQTQRQALLPDAARLRLQLDEALTGLPFQPGLFEPFIRAVETARGQPLLTLDGIGGTLLETRVRALLYQDRDDWFALVTLQGLRDPARVAAALAPYAEQGVRFIDLKAESERLIAGFRGQMLQRIGIAVLLLVLLMGIGLKRRQALRLVVLPATATVLCLVAGLQLAGISLTLFHLVALMLVVGISIDYALYLSRDERDSLGRARSLHSLLICCLSTALGFGILALSEIPVLRAIGGTVGAGVILGLVLGVLGARSAATPE